MNYELIFNTSEYAFLVKVDSGYYFQADSVEDAQRRCSLLCGELIASRGYKNLRVYIDLDAFDDAAVQVLGAHGPLQKAHALSFYKLRPSGYHKLHHLSAADFMELTRAQFLSCLRAGYWPKRRDFYLDAASYSFQPVDVLPPRAGASYKRWEGKSHVQVREDTGRL